MKYQRPIELGWEEWIALPDLNLPAIHAKIDTGAKTSALHTFWVQPLPDPKTGQLWVEFGVHPLPKDPSLEIFCKALVKDVRNITSSNGITETRYVIETPAQFGDKVWPIEISLTNRENMNYRMLIGRTAMAGKVIVVPEQSFLLGPLNPNIYHQND